MSQSIHIKIIDKMKNIRELNLETIELDDQVLLVDKRIQPVNNWYFDTYIKKVKNTSGAEYAKDSQVIQIISSTKPLEGLPLLVIEDEVDNLAINSFGHKPDKEDNDILLSLGKGYVGGFKQGYNKARETYKFTEKDMIEFVVWLNNTDEIFEQTKHIDFTKSDKDVGKELLQIFKEQRPNKELWVETDCEYGDNCPSKGAYDKQYLCKIVPKITNNKIHAVWK